MDFTRMLHKFTVVPSLTGELAALQPSLRQYTRALAAMAEVEDLTTLEEVG